MSAGLPSDVEVAQAGAVAVGALTHLSENGFTREALLVRLCLAQVTLRDAVSFTIRDICEFSAFDGILLQVHIREACSRQHSRYFAGRSLTIERVASAYWESVPSIRRDCEEKDLSQVRVFPSRKGGSITSRSAELGLRRAMEAAAAPTRTDLTFRDFRRVGKILGMFASSHGGARRHFRPGGSLVAEILPRLRSYLENFRYLDVHARDDIAQDTLVSLLASISEHRMYSFDEVFGRAKRLASLFARKATSEWGKTHGRHIPVGGLCELADDLDKRRESPDAGLLTRSVERALGKLPGLQGSAVRLRLGADFVSTRWIAERLGVSEHEARRLVFRGLENLRSSDELKRFR